MKQTVDVDPGKVPRRRSKITVRQRCEGSGKRSVVLVAAVVMTAAVVLLKAPLTASANPGILDPGVRLAAFIEEFHEQGTFGSILDADLSDALRHRLEIALDRSSLRILPRCAESWGRSHSLSRLKNRR